MAQEQEQEPFLLHEKDNNTELTPKSSVVDDVRSPSPSSGWQNWKTHILAHAVLITIYTLLSITFILAHTNNSSSAAPRPAIENLAIEYSKSLFRNLSQSPFAGHPPSSPAINTAWSDLLAPMHIRVTETELRRTNQESVKLVEGGGYLAWLGVFHELHCIKMLREWHYREYYHADASVEEKEHIASHIDHCFEFLRQSSVCHADITSLATFKWHPQKTRPMFNASESVHECVDWDSLKGSIAGRVVSEEEIGRLGNPLVEMEGDAG